MKKFILFVLAMVISFLPGILGFAFTPGHESNAWYNALNISVLTPDGWVFSVAWTILYALLGWALYLIMVDTKSRTPKGKAYCLFAIQLVLNFLWTYVFFGLNMVATAMIVLLVLIGISVWMMRAFYQINRLASYLVWPYIIWMLFATYLNATIMVLN